MGGAEHGARRCGGCVGDVEWAVSGGMTSAAAGSTEGSTREAGGGSGGSSALRHDGEAVCTCLRSGARCMRCAQRCVQGANG